MSEISPLLSFSDYEHAVISTRRNPHEGLTEWRQAYAGAIGDELSELFFQHDPVFDQLLPVEFISDDTDDFGDNRNAMLRAADELGDCLWLVTNSLLHAGASITHVLEAAERAHNLPVQLAQMSLSDFDMAVVQNAQHLRIPNKLYYEGQNIPPEDTHTSLRDNPFYVLQRALRRVDSAQLSESSPEDTPVSVNNIEPPQDFLQVSGESIIAIAFSALCFGVKFQSVAQFNIAKLRHRAEHGKQNDISFALFLDSQISMRRHVLR